MTLDSISAEWSRLFAPINRWCCGPTARFRSARDSTSSVFDVSSSPNRSPNRFLRRRRRRRPPRPRLRRRYSLCWVCRSCSSSPWIHRLVMQRSAKSAFSRLRNSSACNAQRRVTQPRKSLVADICTHGRVNWINFIFGAFYVHELTWHWLHTI